MDEEALKRFQETLDENYVWPCVYVFKFIVPSQQLGKVVALFEGKPFRTRDSSGKKYVSVTVELDVRTSAEVISIYREAAKIEGIISL